MSKKCILDVVFPIIHYLPNKKWADKEGIPTTTNTNISPKKNLALWKKKKIEYVQTNQEIHR